MNQHQHDNQNRLAAFRRRIGYSQRRVATLLGHKSHAALSLYEHGRVQPTLITAIRLEIILRTPVAFLFPHMYERLRSQIRAQEQCLTEVRPQDLANHHSAQRQ